MHPRAGLAVGVVCLVVLAGCGAFVGGSSQPDRETVTPVPVSGDGADSGGDGTGAGAAASMPPGISLDGAVNVTALASAHRASLATRSYNWTYRYRVTRDGAPLFTRTQRVRAGTDALLVRETTTGLGANHSMYVTDRGGYFRTGHAAGSTVERSRQSRDRGTYTALSGEMVRRFTTNVSFSVTVVERNGQTYYRLHAANGAPPRSLVMATREVWNYTATVYVTPGGFVRTVVAEYDYLPHLAEWSEGQVHMSFRYTYAAVGSTTVERPAWVSSVTPTPTGTPATTSSTLPATRSSAPPTANTERGERDRATRHGPRLRWWWAK